MKENELPKNIPIFPLSGAIFFPKTILPLNIFEDRYIQMVSDCMKGQRVFGMVQPKNKFGKMPEVYQVGCLGKIVSFNETSDKRFVISLSGIIRFKIKEELKKEKLYRTFNVDYKNFLNDLSDTENQKVIFDTDSLINKTKLYFERSNYIINYAELKKLNLDQLISTICMISPFSIEEKQKLVETIKIEDKFKALDQIINFNLLEFEENKTFQ